MAKTILVTGGAGFIGSNFCHYVLKQHPDYKVIVVDALTYAGSVNNLPAGFNDEGDGRIRFWYGNVCNAELMDTLVRESTVVVHFAAETHVTRSIYDNLLFYQTDILGTQAIANAILKNTGRIERFIHISTSEVYGSALHPLMDEDHPLLPSSPYASAKCGADRLVYSYWATYGIPAIILRPFNNFGPRQHLEKVVPRFITSVLLDEPLTVHGQGQAARDFIHVEDTCRAIDLVLHAPLDKVAGEVFNIASAEHHSIHDIARDVVRLMGHREEAITFIGDRPGQVGRHTGDWGKISRVLGWRPETGWEEGLRRTIDWFKANRATWESQIWMRKIPIRTARGTVEMH